MGFNKLTTIATPGSSLLALLLLMALPSAHAQSTTTYTEVASILQQRCVMCHSGAAPAAGLRLDSLDALLEGAAGGKVVISGAPGDSELVRRIRGESQPRMPMTGPPFLSDIEIATIEQWIAGGLQAGRVSGTEPPLAAPPRPVELVLPLLLDHDLRCPRFSLTACSSSWSLLRRSSRRELLCIQRLALRPRHVQSGPGRPAA